MGIGAGLPVYGKQVLLCDMDNTIVDFDRGVLESYENQYGSPAPFTLEQRKHFAITKNFPKDLQDRIQPLYMAERFFADLKPIKGAIKGVKTLQQRKYEVFLCTSPIRKNKYCVPEKYEWVEKHLGKRWTEKMVFTKDKSVIKGEYLIDDKPYAYADGKMVASWDQILFDRPYNKHVTNTERFSWDNLEMLVGA